MPMFFHIVDLELPKRMRKIMQRRRTRKKMEDIGEGNIWSEMWKENIWFIWGEGDGERKGGNSDGEGKWTGKKRKREKRTTQPLARWGKAAQICSEIRNLNKKSQVGCRGWWLKMNRWRGGGALWGGWKWHLSHLGAHCDSSNIKFPRGELEISMWILSIRLDFAYFGNSCYFVSIFALNLLWNHEHVGSESILEMLTTSNADSFWEAHRQ